jgi:cyclase
LKTVRVVFVLCVLAEWTILGLQAKDHDFDLPVTKVGHNVYSIVSGAFGLPTPENKGWNSNSHFVVTDGGVLLVDTGSSEVIGNGILRAIKSVTDQPVRWVVNSHSHADHWLGNAVFRDVGASIISTGSALVTMKEDSLGVVEAFAKMSEGATGESRLAFPDQLLLQTKKRNLGGLDVEFLLSNDAHSPGDILVWLPNQKIIIGGDVLSSEWMPILTHHGSIPNLMETLRIVGELNPAVVLPGHGQPTTVLSVNRDLEFLANVMRMVREGLASELGPKQIAARITSVLGPAYSEMYRDFGVNIQYLTSTMYGALSKQ